VAPARPRRPRGRALLVPIPDVCLFPSPPPLAASIHAVVIAGSSGYGNYRHQADAAHAYHTLLAHGVPAANLILLSADDAATSPWNPEPGTLYNRPGGPDVRAGAPVDYSGESVTAASFLAVLLGDARGAAAAAPNSTRRVLNSAPRDRVLVVYIDHGAPGLLGMPAGPPLLAPDLLAALRNMTARRDATAVDRARDAVGDAVDWIASLLLRRHRPRRPKKLPGNASFAELALLVEACESGSMFKGLLPREGRDGVWAATAADARESSWGTYCPNPLSPDPAVDRFQTCLGDLFSVAWMEEADAMLARGLAGVALARESLAALTAHVRERVSQNHTFAQGSHVKVYGDPGVAAERAEAFLGEPERVAPPAPGGPPAHGATLIAHEADALFSRLLAAAGHAAGVQDMATRGAVAATAARVAARFARAPLLAAAANGDAASNDDDVPAVSDWGCLRDAVAAWEAACGRASPHLTPVGRALAAACNAGAGGGAVAAAVSAECGEGGAAAA
jgi:legumain